MCPFLSWWLWPMGSGETEWLGTVSVPPKTTWMWEKHHFPKKNWGAVNAREGVDAWQSKLRCPAQKFIETLNKSPGKDFGPYREKDNEQYRYNPAWLQAPTITWGVQNMPHFLFPNEHHLIQLFFHRWRNWGPTRGRYTWSDPHRVWLIWTQAVLQEPQFCLLSLTLLLVRMMSLTPFPFFKWESWGRLNNLT